MIPIAFLCGHSAVVMCFRGAGQVIRNFAERNQADPDWPDYADVANLPVCSADRNNLAKNLIFSKGAMHGSHSLPVLFAVHSGLAMVSIYLDGSGQSEEVQAGIWWRHFTSILTPRAAPCPRAETEDRKVGFTDEHKTPSEK